VSVPDDPYPEIGQILVRSAAKPWDRIVLEARLLDGAARFKALEYEGNRWSGVSLSDPLRLCELERLQEVTQEVGARTTPRLQTATFTLHSDGEFDVRFGHGDAEGAPPPEPSPSIAPSPPPKRPWWRFWRR
jgi:hypothetical protein